LAGRGLHHRPPEGESALFALARSQPSRDSGYRLSAEEDLKRWGLPLGQDCRDPLGRLLRRLSRRLYIGEGASAKAPARERLDARQAD